MIDTDELRRVACDWALDSGLVRAMADDAADELDRLRTELAIAHEDAEQWRALCESNRVAASERSELLRAEIERLKMGRESCWHCRVTLMCPQEQPHCCDCPPYGECDVEGCEAEGCQGCS